MNPATIIQPFAYPGAPVELQQRSSEGFLRPVEAVTRLRPQGDQRPEGLPSRYQSDESHQGLIDRRRPQAVPMRPARPQSDGFLAQLMAQGQADSLALSKAGPITTDSLARGSEAYRRAGAEPALYAETPSIYRIVA